MPRFHRLAGAVALALACAGTAQAQQFSSFVVFGDSLSDSGNIAAFQGLPPGNSFTTNPDAVAAELIAAAYGLPGGPSLAGGPNFAWGGSCVNPVGPCLNPVPRIPTQIDQYLGLTGGRADPNALYSIWGGANDIFATLALDPLNAQANTLAAASAYVGQIARLQAAGANYVIVYNLPNLGITPQFGPTANAAAVTQITYLYNTAVNTGLAQLGDGIIPINTFGLIEEIVANPSLYGFTNVTGQACGAGSSSVACGPAGSGLPYTYAPGSATWLFADGVHPTGYAHRILASVVVSTIAAPIQVSYAGEAGVQAADDHSRAVSDELMADFALDLEVGSVRGYATAQFGEQDFEGQPGVSAGSADIVSLTLGANQRISENAWWGAALTMGRHDNDIAGANLDSRPVIASLHGALQFGGGGWVSGSIGGGSTDIDISRFIEMGATVRTERGSTSASQWNAEIGLGWLFGQPGGFQHGPFIAGRWVNQDIDGYAEEAATSTSLNYAEFSRDSMVTSFGYQLFGGGNSTVRPYLRVAHNEESEDGQIWVNAGSNSMNGRFTMPGFTPTQDWISADLGLNWAFGESSSFFASYSGIFSNDDQDRSSISIGLRTTF
ncbi:autotransporter domain-containing protein [Arenimonas composti]|uniref:Autotransporter domain-containing protein n=1 Tax=Arenimonas composti TR7-09 = DSM 18010 TaxID=1121013 RepID=A0A091BCS4_9GAMM|nr:autotransporter domain-containing protein [Arenimonas composti]KFN49531.1 hypothetical protein P873_10280 [Arenimonas composti TR7-09 = DSM 18010]